jgi:hypothetical protein
MTRTCCPSCRLRFSRETAARLTACPWCAGQLDLLAADAVLGFRLTALDEVPTDIDLDGAAGATVPAWPPAGLPHD